ncbi:hypothetical protein [Blastococcus sp. CT_GayMR16]|uniref:hypothetical protein n=1 Tax=Blastococcus sp. CT_GayMR16 TaxID=2559607 RepID=UPI001073BA1B|nr:hypothetical protein [Blastococcus sp. CT_GayMR16]TFV87999.1 hypothetical protein E4P38_12030 [Blastococcus sp. CT_GayMR16]
MILTVGVAEDLVEVVRELAPLELPAVAAGSSVPSAAVDASPSRDRLARIAAMIRDAEQAMAAHSHHQRRSPEPRLIPLAPRRNRARLRRDSAASVDLAS